MGNFSTMALAEARAKTLMSTGAATVAHSCRLKDGTIAVRLLRPLSLAGFTGQDTADRMNKAGAWDTVTDDSAT